MKARDAVGNKGTSATEEGGSRARGRGGRRGHEQDEERGEVKTRSDGRGRRWGSRQNQTTKKQRAAAWADETGWWSGKVVDGGGWSWWSVVAGKEAGRRMGGVEEYDLRTRRRRTPKDG